MSEMLERILSDENIRRAKKRVYANKGAGGVDGVTVQELDEYMSRNSKSDIRAAIQRPQLRFQTEKELRAGNQKAARIF